MNPDKYLGRQIDLTSSTESGSMVLNMLTPAHYFKVLYSIVGLSAINVMDYFIRIKFSAQGIFHNKSMLKLVSLASLAAHEYLNIALAIFNSTTLPSRLMTLVRFYISKVTILRAKYLVTSFMALIMYKLFVALLATKMTLSRFIVTIPITKLSLLARWGIKLTITSLTDMFHIEYYSIKCMEML